MLPGRALLPEVSPLSAREVAHLSQLDAGVPVTMSFWDAARLLKEDMGRDIGKLKDLLLFHRCTVERGVILWYRCMRS